MRCCDPEVDERVGRARRARRVLFIFVMVLFSVARADDLLPPMTLGIPAEFAPRRAGADVGADRQILVSQEGLYRITFSALAAAGISNPVGSQLRLFCRTQEIALAVSSEGLWSTNDYAVFYGWPHGGNWSITNVYWLGIGGTGLRMSFRNATPQPGWPERTTHWRTARYGPDRLFIPTYRPQDGGFDHWVAHLLTNMSSVTITVATPHRVLSQTGSVSLLYWGRSATNHATRFTINSGLVQTSSYAGQSSYTTNFLYPQTVLSNGANTIRFQQLLGDSDSAWVDWMELMYVASNVPIAGELAMEGMPISNNYVVSPWNTNEVPWLLDITKRGRPVLLTNFALQSSGSTGLIRWADFAFETNRFWIGSPTTLIDAVVSPPVLFSGFTSAARQADYLFITHPTLATGAYQLAKHRARDGMRTLIVPIDSVYNEFSYGIKDARAIKQFIGYAYHHWAAPPPRYVLLVGDGNFDPFNNYGVTNNTDLIPVWMGPAAFDYSAQDGWFATVDGSDYLRDVQIGRLPFSTHALVTGAITRLMSYENASTNATWRGKALYVADTNGPPNNFQTISDTHILTNLLKAGIATNTRAYFNGANSAAVLNTMTNVINGTNPNGPVFSVSYFGHGWNNDWAVGFNNGHVATMNNPGSQPIFTVWTCANGAFANPTNQSMAERLMERPFNRGASAVLSASALSVNEAARTLADGFFRSFTNAPPRHRLGDAIDAGCLNLFGFSTNSEELLFYNLFGDPAQVVRP